MNAEENKETERGIQYVGSMVNTSNSQRSVNEDTEVPEVTEADNFGGATSSAADFCNEEETTAHTKEFYDEKTIGTEYQKVIVKDYPMITSEDKLKVPYIERFNGNLSV